MNIPRIAAISFSALSIGAVHAELLQWSNSEIQYLHGSDYQEPGNPADISQSIITVTHSHGWALGRNFFFMDTLFSEHGVPSQINLYGEAYSSLSFSKISQQDLSFALFKDFSLTGGVNLGENLNISQSGFRALLYGVSVDFDLPGFSYLNVDFLRQQVSEPFNIGTTWQITPVWSLPFSIAGSQWSFEGFADVIGKKGAAAQQILAQPQLRLDVGDLLGQPHHLYLGMEYQYWHNKYGIKDLHDKVAQTLLVWKF